MTTTKTEMGLRRAPPVTVTFDHITAKTVVRGVCVFFSSWVDGPIGLSGRRLGDALRSVLIGLELGVGCIGVMCVSV